MKAHLAYLKTETMTACQPKLRLLLIKTALQLARHSLQSWAEPMPEATFRALSSLRKTILQLLTSIEGEKTQLGTDIQSIYLYLFRTVTEAQLGGDAQKIHDLVKVLEVESETWQILTQRYVDELMTVQPTNQQISGESSTLVASPRASSAVDGGTRGTVANACFSVLA